MKWYILFHLPALLLIFLSQVSLSQNIENLTEQEAVRIDGSINMRLQFYGSDKTNPSRSPFMWYLQGSPVLTIYGVTMPFSFRLSEQQREFRQPFNQFGVSPFYKWMKLHLGYSSLNWSNYALAGHSISGAGTVLTPGNFKVGIVTGRLLKPIKYLDHPEHAPVQTPAYRRMGTAFTLGYGNEKNNLNIVILKAKDDSTSVDGIPLSYQLTPDENLVVSVASKQTIAKNFLFEFELAQSLYTKDLRTELSDSTEGFMAKTFSSLFDSRVTTTSDNAFRTSFGYQSDLLGLMMKYERVEPDFRSMGAYYFLTDVENITIEPSVKIIKKMLTVGGSFGSQIDNLNKDKNLQTRRTIGSVRANFVPIPQYNLSVFYSTYGLAQESGLLSIDTLRQNEIAQATNQYGFTQSLNLMGEKWGHNVMTNFNAQRLKDKNENTAHYSEYSTIIFMGGYFLNYMPIGTNASLSYVYTKFLQDTLSSTVAGPSIGLGKSFMKNKLNAGFTLTSMDNLSQQESIGKINTTTIQIGYTPVRKHRFALRYYNHNNKGKSESQISYFENKLDFDYTFTF
jgi:hypothetical protein